MKYIKKLGYKIFDFFFTLVFHRQMISDLQDQLLEPFDLRLKKLSAVEGEGVKAVLEHPLFRILAQLAAEAIRRTEGAEGRPNGNFVVADMFYEGQKYSLTLEKAGMKTPTESITELRARITELENEIVTGQAWRDLKDKAVL